MKNAMQAFVLTECLSEYNRRDWKEFFRLMRSNYLRRARKLHQMTTLLSAITLLPTANVSPASSFVTTVPPPSIQLMATQRAEKTTETVP